jgi:hypothetical protein
MADRVIADASFREIIDRKKRVGRDLHARAYFFEPKSLFIISAVSGGYEIGSPAILPETVTDEELGRIVCDRLILFDTNTPLGLNLRKMTEWPAFVASGARSVTSLQSHSWGLSIDTISDNSVLVNVSPLKTLHPEITVSGIARPKHLDVGRVARRALAGAITLRKGGVI